VVGYTRHSVIADVQICFARVLRHGYRSGRPYWVGDQKVCPYR